MSDLITAWAERVADEFRKAEPARRYTGTNPEKALVLHTLQALAEDAGPATAAVLEYVDRRRAGMVPS